MLLRTTFRPPARARLSVPGRPAAPPARAPSPRAAPTSAAPASAAAPPEVAGAFAGVKDMASFQAVLAGGAAAGKVPEALVPAFMDFYNNYRSKLWRGGGRGPRERERESVGSGTESVARKPGGRSAL